MPQKETCASLTPLDIVADAAMVAIWQPVKWGYATTGSIRPDKSNLNWIFSSRNRGKCQENSAYALWYIASQPESKNLFSNYLLITSYGKTKSEIFHSYLLIQDSHANWYAASPANLPATIRVLQGNLTEVVSKFKPDPKKLCTWPTAEEIIEIIESSPKIIPSKHSDPKKPWSGKINLLEIQKLSGKIIAHESKINFDFRSISTLSLFG
ncbi:MAG: hypothetical protein V1810_00300 [Candidatus Beckwithbacteria bacterium]